MTPASSFPLAYLEAARKKYLKWPANIQEASWGTPEENTCLPSLLGDDIYHRGQPGPICGEGATRSRVGYPKKRQLYWGTLVEGGDDRELEAAPSDERWRKLVKAYVDYSKNSISYRLTADGKTTPSSKTAHIQTTLDRISSDANSTTKDRFPLLINTETPSPLPPTTMVCGDLGDQDLPERFCETTNIVINVQRLPGVIFGDETDEELARKERNLGSGLDWWAENGVVKAQCGMDENWWFGGNLWGSTVGGSGWLMRALEVQEPQEVKEQVQCDAWIETPLFFASRWDTTNPYQAHQDFLNTFRVYSALGINADEILPVFLDSRDVDGPYTQIWADVFGGGSRVLDIRELSSVVVEKWRRSQKSHERRDANESTTEYSESPEAEEPQQAKRPIRNLCLRKAVWGIHGGISPIAKGGIAFDKCAMSPLLHAFSGFMKDRIKAAVNRAEGKRELIEMSLGPNLNPEKPDEENVVSGVHFDNTQPQDDGLGILGNLMVNPEQVSEKPYPGYRPYVEASSQFRNRKPIPNPNIFKNIYPRSVAEKPRPLRVTYAIRKATTNPSPLKSTWSSSIIQGIEGYVETSTNATTKAPKMPPLSWQNDIHTPPKGSLSRKVSDQATIISHLQQTVESWKPPPKTHITHATFTAVDFATLPIEEQVKLAETTDVFIAPHGAVFIHTLYLRNTPLSGILEIQPPERSVANHQFRNLATRLGRNYKRLSVGHGLLPEHLIKSLGNQTVDLMNEVAGSMEDLIRWAKDGRKGEWVGPVPNNEISFVA
ncbi:hypothetical protein HDU97_007708 [Phlyctochytrium planicorne]|nr:hypothetical protein HDU97_007708 [Phlyctochytrium planicorne]